MKAYIELVNWILETGTWKDNRTGVRTIGISGAAIEHDMADGFPALTTKRLAFRTMAVELEAFIKGITDKAWLQERGCHIWDEWANPEKIPSGLDREARIAAQRSEMDLGRIYGAQWRDFGGVDQLAGLVKTLETNPWDRRMIVSAWNPPELGKMALPPCHLLFQVIVTGDGRLNLNWYQRSVDTMLGLPFNIASYGLLLELLAHGCGRAAGRLCGFLGDVHIYENHVETARIQAAREPLSLPKLALEGFKDVFDWTFNHASLLDYKAHEKLTYEMTAI